MRPVLAALAAFTLVNGAITMYLVRTMYATSGTEGAAQQQHLEQQQQGDLRGAPFIAAGGAALHEESESPTRGVLAQRAVAANTASLLEQQEQAQEEEERPFPTAGPRRWRVRCTSYKKETKMRRYFPQ